MKSAEQKEQWLAQRDAAGPHCGIPFPPVHGAWSPQIVNPLAREIASGLVAVNPDLAHFPALDVGATILARYFRYCKWHEEVGVLDEDGNIRGGHHFLVTERQALAVTKQLGLDPISNAHLRKLQAETAHIVVDLESIRARGAEALARRDTDAPTIEANGGNSDV